MSEIGQKIIAETRKVASERPDFVYQGDCAYVEYGQPACLVGHALWNLGLIDIGYEQSYNNDAGVRHCLHELHIEIDGNEAQWLMNVQDKQDSKAPWSEAVTFADNYGL